MEREDSITLYDATQMCEEEYQKYLYSKQGEQIRSEFMRKLTQHVTSGDNEKLKEYLRNEKDDLCKRFEKVLCSKILNTCFDATTNSFDEHKFYYKMSLLYDGDIPKEEISEYYEYKLHTCLIDCLMKKILEYEDKQSFTSININNIVIAGGDININQEHLHDSKGEEKDGSEGKSNIIFNPRLFDTNDKLTRLFECVCSFIDLDAHNWKICEPACVQIQPECQNEWYYIYKALDEAEIVHRQTFTDAKFVMQMIVWFPWLFIFNSVDEMNDFKRRFAKSISAERKKWKYGKTKAVTQIKDMWARQKTLRFDYAKLTRLHSVASQLKTKLSELKTELQKENIH